MIHDILTSAGLNVAIRNTANGEEYAGFKMITDTQEFSFTCIYRNHHLRIILHEVLPAPTNSLLSELLNAVNEKWLTVKFYFNAQSGFVEGSATLLNIENEDVSEQIFFYLRQLQEYSLQLRLLAEGREPEEFPAEPTIAHPDILPTLKNILIENDYSAKWKFEGSVLATYLLTPHEKKIVLEFMIVDNETLFIQSYTEDTLPQDGIPFFFDRMQFYNWTLDTGTIACIPGEFQYYFFQAIPLRFLKLETVFVKNRISQCIQAHEYASNDLQKMYEIK